MHKATTKVIAAGLLTALVSLGALGGWLLATESGLIRILAVAKHAPGVMIDATGAHGSLLRGFRIETLTIDHERVRIEIHSLAARLNLRAIPIVRLGIEELKVRQILIDIKPRLHPPDHAPITFLPRPLSIAARGLLVEEVAVRAGTGPATTLSGLVGSVLVTHSAIEATDLSLDGGALALQGRVTLGAGNPLALSSDATFKAQVGGRNVAGTLVTSGTLERLAVHLTTRLPQPLRIEGEVTLDDTVSADARLSFDDLDLAAVGLHGAPGPVSGALAIKGAIHRFTVGGTVAATGVPGSPFDVTAEAGYESSAVVLHAARVSSPGIRPAPTVTASGSVGVGSTPTLDLTLAWTNVSWPLGTRNPAVTSARGQGRLTGPSPFRFDVSGAVQAESLPAAQLAVRGTMDASWVSIDALDAHVAGGSLTGNGTLALEGARRWRASLVGHGIDPGALRPALRGRVDLALRAEGEGFQPLGHWNARIDRLTGTVRGLPASGHGAITARDGALHFDDVGLVFGSATLAAAGDLGRQSDVRWRLRIERLGDFLPDAAGSLRSRGTASGDLEHLVLQANLGARDLALGNWHAGQITAEADLDATDHGPSYLKLTALNVGHGTHRADRVGVTLDGHSSDHTLTVRVNAGSESGELASHGAYRRGTWTIQLESLGISGPPLLAYRLDAPSTLVLHPGRVSLTRTCLIRGESTLCALGGWEHDRPWAATLDVTAVPLALAGLRLPKDMSYAGAINAHAQVNGAPGRPWTGDGNLELRDGEFRYRGTDGKPVTVRVGNGRIELLANADAYSTGVGIATEGGSYLAGSARVDRNTLELAAAPVSGEFRMSSTELGAIPVLIPGVDRMVGHLEGQFLLSGTMAAPLLGGSAHFGDGEVDSYRTNLLLRAVDAKLDLQGDTIAITATANTRGGSATAAGQIAWQDRKPVGRLRFTGEHLLLADLPEAQVTASPTLDFTIAHNTITVRGEIAIPSARIAPVDLRRAVLVSGDEHIVGDTPPTPGTRLAVDAAVRFILGDDVSLDAYGLKGKLGGNLLVTSHDGEVASGSGEFNVREGKYSVYSRELDIEHGRLLFAGQSLSNPGVDIRAQRVTPSLTAGVNVRGTLLKPQITLFSDPSLSQAQIAAVLIMGKTLDDVQDADKSSAGSAEARAMLLAQGSALLAGELGRYVGISDVGVETGTNNSTSLVFGRFLSPRLYVSYGVSITETLNTLKLRYTIGDRWVIRTESGAKQSADIEYTIQH